MRYVKERYAILGLDVAMQKMQTGTLPPYALAITFDDGYRNMYEYAFPVLKEYAIPATMFLATDFVFNKQPLWVDRLEYAIGYSSGSREEKIARDQTLRDTFKTISQEEKERRLRDLENAARVTCADFEGERAVYAPLSVEEIREMQRHEITFGAHTKSHPILSRVSAAQAADEVRGSKEILERECGTISSVFAYPNGQREDWNDEIENIVKESGFSSALTTIEGVNTSETNVFRLRRMTMDGTGNGSEVGVIVSGIRSFLRNLKQYAT